MLSTGKRHKGIYFTVSYTDCYHSPPIDCSNVYSGTHIHNFLSVNDTKDRDT